MSRIWRLDQYLPENCRTLFPEPMINETKIHCRNEISKIEMGTSDLHGRISRDDCQRDVLQ
jgi:hypothetical protein